MALAGPDPARPRAEARSSPDTRKGRRASPLRYVSQSTSRQFWYSRRGMAIRAVPGKGHDSQYESDVTVVSVAIDRRRLGEEAFQDVIDHQVVFLLEAGMRDARHDGEMLVRVW